MSSPSSVLLPRPFFLTLHQSLRHGLHQGLQAIVAALALCGALTYAPAKAQGTGASTAAASSPAATPYDLREHYTKYEYRVPMRDGKRLFTVVYAPKSPAVTVPFLVQRTPYGCGPYGVDRYAGRVGPNEEFQRAGYLFVCQDVRGRHMSEGEFVEMRPHKTRKGATDIDESTDMHDTVQWLLENIPGHNGRVGIWGISYPGFYTSASIIDSHPAIRAASPQAPIADLFMGDDSYHGGAFMLPHNYGFNTFFKPQDNPTPGPRFSPPFEYGTSDGYEYFLKLGNLSNIARTLGPKGNPYFDAVIDNDRYNDFWKSRNILPHLKNIKAAVLTVGGWFDAENLQGALSTYRAIERQNPGISNALVMGPWVHGGWLRGPGKALGHVDFAVKNSEHFQKRIMLPFFEQHLKDKPDAKLAEATVFETGTNVWRSFDAWPPQKATRKTLYFREGQRLAWEPPKAAGVDQYISDPNRPVPFIGYTDIGMPAEHMVADQRFASTRPDVLVYMSEVLEEDITIAGPVSPRLFVSPTGSDADWVVKLLDVYPADLQEGQARARPATPQDVAPPRTTMAGYQQLLRGNPLRARFRHGFDQPMPVEPGKVEPISFDMPDVLHTFRRGHRIMVHVQSSWFPMIDRNPQTFVPRIKDAQPQDFKAATQRVMRSAAQPSGVELWVMP